jgi:hypothetical protein
MTQQTDNYYSLSYLLTPWNRVRLEKLTGFQLVKKFPTFYGTSKFITASTCARHLSLSLAKTDNNDDRKPVTGGPLEI